MIEGIILAAGYASRVGINKILLDFQGKPLLQHAIDGMKPFVSHIYVVTGHYHTEIDDYLNKQDFVTCIYNPSYENGMFTSVQSGIQLIQEDCFILPGDCPLVAPSVYKTLLDTTKEIAVPIYQGRKGHPIFLRKPMVELLRKEDSSSNLKAFRNRFDYDVLEVEDSGILIDIDTKQDYIHLMNPSRKE